MNTLIRVKRILEPLKRFYLFNEMAQPIVAPGGVLGDVIGFYDNSIVGVGKVWIYTDGLAWMNGDKVKLVRFGEIERVDIPNGDKKCTEIELFKKDRQVLVLPIKGNDGVRFDSMEMVRFLDRVLADLRVKKSQNT